MWNPMEAMGMGHREDSLIAHITPKEAMILKAMGGKGSVNPHTGFLQFFSDNGGDMGHGDFGGGESTGDGGDGGYGGWTTPDIEDAEIGAAMTDNIESSNMGIGDRTDQGINPQTSLNWNDKDMQNMGMMEGLGAKARQSLYSFMDDPVSALTPSYSTLGSILGMLSPVPGGSLMGYGMGKMVDKYGFGGPGAEIMPSPERMGGSEEGTAPMAAPMAEPMAQSFPGGLEPSPAMTSLYSPNNYADPWRNASNRGTGGGGLGRLLRG